ncbi:uncharacterized protein LOC114195557 [Vigna unguiculata]|uniref:uncharacterized protein LOC114195557 n=1 Tax=Vigna unguiculata TaxID=3917 RepID=UPI001015F34B|nr:uncharacterized protein LOC114195557 [Vigna unguiculata]
MNPGSFEEELSSNPSDQVAEYILEGKWQKIVNMYNQFPACHTAMIYPSVGTALHVAVDLEEEAVVDDLVNAIIRHKTMKALKMRNYRGDTALHVAASRGFAKICELIIGTKKERIYLMRLENKEGETPLFQAALNWKKLVFAYLSNLSGHTAPLQDLVRDNGDTILHCAIRREYFDLAVIILHYYDFLRGHLNNEGFTPLKLLATRPSAFRSATKLSWWKQILYHFTLVEELDPKRQMETILEKVKKQPKSDEPYYPKSYVTLCDFIAGFKCLDALTDNFFTKRKQQDPENPSTEEREIESKASGNAFVLTLRFLGVGFKEIRNIKRRHQWSGQLLLALLERPYAAFTGSGGVPTDMKAETDMYNVYSEYIQGEPSEPSWLKEEEEEKGEKEEEKEEEEEEDNETPFLVAARNGIVEMVNELLDRIPNVIHDRNSMKDNVLLVAVINRQPLLIENLKTKIRPEVWNSLILEVDRDERTILHCAAYAPMVYHRLKILQMMWDIKWFQYIKSLVPKHFNISIDKRGRTAWEIFEETHQELIKESSDWLKETFESCFVVATLVAGVSFATASSIPGGTDEEGRPHFEGNPAFDVFAVASLVGLCSSVTGIIMFLIILTSLKQSKDFRRILPFKILLALTSPFVSIAAMLVSFCSGHYFLLSHRYKTALYPIYAAAAFPIIFYAVAQFPLYFDLIIAIFSKVPRATVTETSYSS